MRTRIGDSSFQIEIHRYLALFANEPRARKSVA